MTSTSKSRIYAPAGGTFSPEAFADQIGRVVDGFTIVAAVVVEGGHSVELTLETNRSTSGRICVDPRCPAGRAHYDSCPAPHRKDPS